MPDRYQSFDDQQGSSPSEKKTPLLQLPTLEGKTVLDIGCNAGFFSFECEKRGAMVTAIEKNQVLCSEAVIRKIRTKSSVEFHCADWFDWLEIDKNKYDVILMTAAFHYIKGRQEEFLKRVYDHLNHDGLLILEVGIHQGISSEIKTVKRSGDGGMFQYPTWPKLYKMLVAADFDTVHTIGDGINMEGDPIPRFVIHCKKN